MRTKAPTKAIVLPARPVQGSCPATAAMFNSVLHSALPAGQFGMIVELLQLMKAANLEVDPAVSSMVGGPCFVKLVSPCVICAPMRVLGIAQLHWWLR